ncbi:aminopeptidase N-like [Erpetoichthys calabaricus]|uniref:aminopeptidase N-like n=1 Tax=Erpetoichthys calabaricus TaxID=27687 RepID=UPI00223437A3|nr:aminopeptidase N-like [Erpetoichthys calabaricus]
MKQGFYISKALAVVFVFLAVIGIVIIISLAVVCSEEKAKNVGNAVTPIQSIRPSTSTTLWTTPSTAMMSTSQPKKTWNHIRLPMTLIPEFYNVTLWPRLTQPINGMYIFTGNSTVRFTCKEATNLILIHCNMLNLTLFDGHHAILTGGDGANPPAIINSWWEKDTQYLVLQLQGELQAGKSYSLFTEFTGELADDLAGFYRSEYTEDGEKRIIATTQMQPTDARKAFPCFDEPALKARFSFTVIHEPQFLALSNSPLAETKELIIEGITWTVSKFEETEIMSTYLTAFIVCDFASIEVVEENILVRIWARKEAIYKGHGNYSLKTAASILKYLEAYYNISYPLPKSDQIAVPDFNFFAMENWGLLVYHENGLLLDPNGSSTQNKENIAFILAHELAHQWFGNLVTMKWWNDLWLNEGFATYVQYLGVDFVEPSWSIKDLFVVYEVHYVFGVDALPYSRPLSAKEEEINTLEDINGVIDAITYSKGAAVLRMLSSFLTEDLFRKGLSSYLKAFQFRNTVYLDLWNHLQQAVNEQQSIQLPTSISDIMNRWTRQMGFPLVTFNTTSGEISQKHFLLDQKAIVRRTSEYNYTWHIPVSWMKSGILQPLGWLLNKSETKPELKVTGAEWVLANINVTGYYRVNYDMQNWERLLSQLQRDHSIIPINNRAQIISDAFSLAQAEYIPITLALNTTRYLSKDTEYIPWISALANLKHFFLMFDRSEVYGPMQAYLRKQVHQLYEHFENSTENFKEIPSALTAQYSQRVAVWIACEYGLKKCRDLSSGLYKQWMDKPSANPIHPNLRSLIYCSAIASGGVEVWDFGWKMFRNTTFTAESDRLRYALSCAKEPWLLNRYLEYSLNQEYIRKQDSISTISYIASNVVGQSLVWDFIRSRWETLFNKYGSSFFLFSHIINKVSERFASESELRQLEQFKKDNEHIGFGVAAPTMTLALERTRSNIKWVNKNKQEVLKWFQEASE